MIDLVHRQFHHNWERCLKVLCYWLFGDVSDVTRLPFDSMCNQDVSTRVFFKIAFTYSHYFYLYLNMIEKALRIQCQERCGCRLG